MNRPEENRYQNPTENINERDFEKIQDVPIYVIEALHREVAGTNVGAYCATHHSLETRSTKARHQPPNCQLIEGSHLKGKAQSNFVHL